jgi:hypothetical protein
MQACLTFVATRGFVACAHLPAFQSNPRFGPLVCRMQYLWRDDINDLDRSIGSFDGTRLGRRAGRAPRIFANAGDRSVSKFRASECSDATSCVPGRCRYLRCVMREDEVAGLGLIVAGEAGFHGRRSGGCAVYEGSEPPAARRGVFRGIFDHTLNVLGGPGTKDWAWPKSLLCRPGGVNSLAWAIPSIVLKSCLVPLNSANTAWRTAALVCFPDGDINTSRLPCHTRKKALSDVTAILGIGLSTETAQKKFGNNTVIVALLELFPHVHSHCRLKREAPDTPPPCT